MSAILSIDHLCKTYPGQREALKNEVPPGPGKSLLGMRVTDVLEAVARVRRKAQPERLVLCGRRDSALVACLAALSQAGVITIADPAEAAGQLANHAMGGIRYLMLPPLATARQRQAHARKVLDFLLRAWAPAA